LAAVVQRLPQVLVNVQVRDRRIASLPGVAEAVRVIEDRLGTSGRVLLRPSGTEPLVRVMVEATTQDEAELCAEFVADVVRRAAGD
ncbi:MAG TPA: phosphoglucosamine mutase, partial [Solirubrobacteraceae bacterium]|nr:phosphoglucosamine mutase [Solirubrobacteraceae bacterium]